jgi:DNA polymerase-3 subunit delta'
MTAGAVLSATELPWLQQPMARVRAALASERAPHSLLVSGQQGAGLKVFADWLITLRHCVDVKRAPCGVCKSCVWNAQGNHPDHYLLTPLEDSREIRIDQVRELLDQLAMTGHGGRQRSALVFPAERLNRNAANSFLKMLEEPPGGSLLVLATASPSRLPATIRSRCLRIDLPLPSPADSATWLSERNGGKSESWRRVLSITGNRPAIVCESDLAAALQQVGELEADALALAAGEREPLLLAKQWDDEHYDFRLTVLENLITKYLLHDSVTSTRHLLSAAYMPKLRAMFEVLDRVRDDRMLAETPVNRRHGLTALLTAAQAALRSAGVSEGGAR